MHGGGWRKAALASALALGLVPAAMTACGGGASGGGSAAPAPSGAPTGGSSDAGTNPPLSTLQCTVGNGLLAVTLEQEDGALRLRIRGSRFASGAQVQVSADVNGDGVLDTAVVGIADANGAFDVSADLPPNTDPATVTVQTSVCTLAEPGTANAGSDAGSPAGSTRRG